MPRFGNLSSLLDGAKPRNHCAMSRIALAFVLAPLLIAAAPTPKTSSNGPAQWQAQARQVTIRRDDWGIAHVAGKSDADAVFGMIFAQAEDDFPRIERNLLEAMGRLAEVEGEQRLWSDLRARLFYSEPELKAWYRQSSPRMRSLMQAWADGLNHFLATHPATKPQALQRFEPWMALARTEGSIGGDIEGIDLEALAQFYGAPQKLPAINAPVSAEPSGSNGIAIAAPLVDGAKSLLLINPHTSFYYRSELHMKSEEGLDVYGAATWGQFFIYQGFNRHAGWMHTSSGVDNVDEFAEHVEQRASGPCYRFGKICRPLGRRAITIAYRDKGGSMKTRDFTAWTTHRGPIVRADGGRWMAFAMMHKPVAALAQSFERTKAKNLKDYLKVADLKANSSNVTIFADDSGNIAMLMPQFMPQRPSGVSYAKPVDGSDPTLDWGKLHALNELPSMVNPPNHWVMNVNDSPWNAAGKYSHKANDYPDYMDMAGENPRTTHALALLQAPGQWSLDRLQQAAYDPRQPGFDKWLPDLLSAFDAIPKVTRRHAKLSPAIEALRRWDRRWSATSVPNTVANFWLDEMWSIATDNGKAKVGAYVRLDGLKPSQKLDLFEQGYDKLVADFGRWDVPWGEVNRFQRLSSDITSRFDDDKPSIAVPFTSAVTGSLASFGVVRPKGQKRWYGDYGNSFVAVVAFTAKGPVARAITAGGESGNPSSPHFTDEGARYASGNLRAVYFSDADLQGHVERTYHPGE